MRELGALLGFVLLLGIGLVTAAVEARNVKLRARIARLDHEIYVLTAQVARGQELRSDHRRREALAAGYRGLAMRVYGGDS
jgi:hypothetical protein